MSAALAALKGAAISSPKIPMTPSEMRFMAVPLSQCEFPIPVRLPWQPPRSHARVESTLKSLFQEQLQLCHSASRGCDRADGGMAALSRRIRPQRAHEHLHAVVEGDEGAEFHDLRLAPVFLHPVIERLVHLIGVKEHQIGVTQRAFLGLAKSLAV